MCTTQLLQFIRSHTFLRFHFFFVGLGFTQSQTSRGVYKIRNLYNFIFCTFPVIAK